MEKFLKEELLALLEKARAGNATGDDYSRIAAIINADETGELIAEADAFFAQEVPLSTMHIEPYDYDHWQRAFLEIKEAYQQQNIQPAKVRRLPAASRWLIAASILLLLAVGAYLFINTRSTQQTTASTEILPGKDGAILTLADGTQILLDTIKSGVVALQGGATAKIVNGTLIYDGNSGEAVYNIMTTPKGRRFHLIMPDGTEAWLNSASSIQFPTAFTGNERKVSVTGEVYFEVATLRSFDSRSGRSGQKMPFRLNVNNKAEIEVLGTHFNVKAYENEPVINTTLLEGSIAIRLKDDKKGTVGKQSILKPGQQAKIVVGENTVQVNVAKNGAAQNANGKDAQQGLTVVNNTDIDKVMAWKNNVFDFNDIAFTDAMYQLERWYNIEVVYEKGVPPTNVELSGKITKDVTLNDLVTILEKIGLKCKLEGRKLLIQS
jgi:ferric-dicitrate binding protein FerR (iron transport regulator)